VTVGSYGAEEFSPLPLVAHADLAAYAVRRDAVTTALAQDGARRAEELKNATLRESFDSLSARERDVVARVAAGALNKQIAAELGLSEVTVKVHRAKAMRKLHAKSLAELVRMIEALRNHRLASAQLPSGGPFSCLKAGQAECPAPPPRQSPN
jgi:DNA-binding NarL/FixJ family response regulator